jgi:hypothetical protein
MQAADATKIVNFFTKIKLDNEPMKAYVVNALNALMLSPDPVSVRFCQTLNEALNRAAVAVINESAGAPPVIPQMPAAPQQQQVPVATPAAICEAMADHASKLMI